MGEPAGNEELTVVVGREFDGDVLAERGRPAADVDGDVEHGPFDDADQFGLGVGRFLEMQAAQNAVGRTAFVVLHETDGADLVAELALRITLEEITAGVAEDTGFEDDNALDVGADDFHGQSRLVYWVRSSSSTTFNRYLPYSFLSMGCANSIIRSREIQPCR